MREAGGSMTEHDKEIKNQTIDEMAQIIIKLYNTMSCIPKCNIDNISCEQCVLERAIKQMKEGTE